MFTSRYPARQLLVVGPEDPEFCEWLLDMELVDSAIPFLATRRRLAFDGAPLDTADVLTARLRTHGIQN